MLKPGVLLIYKTPKVGQWVGTVLLHCCELIERPSKKDGFCFKLFHPLDQSVWAVKVPLGRRTRVGWGVSRGQGHGPGERPRGEPCGRWALMGSRRPILVPPPQGVRRRLSVLMGPSPHSWGAWVSLDGRGISCGEWPSRAHGGAQGQGT